MVSIFINPRNGLPLEVARDELRDAQGNSFPIVGGIPRFCRIDNYAANFGKQWNLFDRTQIDGAGATGKRSATRFFAASGWTPEELAGTDVLEVGSGAGRFSRVLLEHTKANLYSIDYSIAVEANLRNNSALGGCRFHLAQASIYAMPFPDDRFDKIICLGVLQHTPNFERSVQALVRKAKVGGEIVVDFYPIRHALTKLHAKYLLRPITRRMRLEHLLRLIDRNADWLLGLSRGMNRVGLHALTRFLPMVDLRTFPKDMPFEEVRETAVLDTLDMLSPQYDNPQRIETVMSMFERAGAKVHFAGYVDVGTGQAAVVRATKFGGDAQ